MEPSFSGWITKYGVECNDGRTIMHGAFAGQAGESGTKLPLVYQHQHNDINQVLGHVIATKKPEGIWGDAYLDETPQGKNAKIQVDNKSLDKFSIWAKNLDQRVDRQKILVHDGVMQEVSLCLTGSNSGAVVVPNVLSHDDLEEFQDNNLMVVMGELMHADGSPIVKVEEKPAPVVEPPETKTVADVLETLSEEQQTAVNSFIDGIVDESVTEAVTQILTGDSEMAHSDLIKKILEGPELSHDDLLSNILKGTDMGNLFDQSNKNKTELPQLKHDDMHSILLAAKGNPQEGIRGFNDQTSVGSLRTFIRSQPGQELMHADTYGVQNIEILFPDAQAVMARPTWVDRRQDWVKKWMAGTSHQPFSRIKTMYADITADEARAKGYIKANQKTEEVFPVFKRTTGPAWIYKKQKLDRSDIIDIVDFDVVAWMKAEMRGKLDEEVARAGLFGDGRPVMIGDDMNPDKIPEPTGASGDGIRSVVNDDDLYSTEYSVPMVANATGTAWNVLLDTVVEAGEHYLGSGNKTAFVSYRAASKLLTIRDDFGHRIYRNLSEVAGDMDVNEIVRVPTELFPTDVLAIVLDMVDYTYGTNRGGEVTLFDDFDIDFNQYKYLIETYLSGALILPYSAQIFKRVNPAGTLVEPVSKATFDADTNTVTVPTQTGVVYKRTDTNATVAGGSTIVLNNTTLKQVTVEAQPASSSYYFKSDDDRFDAGTFRYKAPAS